MRTWVYLGMLVSGVASASPPLDDTVPGDTTSTTSIRVRRLTELPPEGFLHLDDLRPIPALGAGGIVDGRAITIDLGPRAQLAAEGTWWQTGVSPSMFTEDLRDHGWRAAAELSYDLGPFRVGVNAAIDQGIYGSHRMVGLFAYRTFHLSRWMHAWIALGLTFEEWTSPAASAPQQGVTAGLSLGTTFR